MDAVAQHAHEEENKRLRPLVWDGGKASSEQSVVQQMRPKQIRRTGTYDSRARSKINNEAPATQVGHMLKMAEHFEALEPPRKKSKRVVRVEGIKVEEVREQRNSSLMALEAELERLTEANEN